MGKNIRPALMCFLVMTVICGVFYTVIVTGVAQVLFPYQANGSILSVDSADGGFRDYGSALIGQEFTGAGYLIGRPTGVTNLSPVSPEQRDLVQKRVSWLRSLDPENDADIPMDLVTASGSGVDPNITPDAALYQLARIARVRGISEEDVLTIFNRYTTAPFFGGFGGAVVNVLQVNLALDGLF